MKKITIIAIVAICLLAITFNATAQKVTRQRATAPVVNLPNIKVVKDTAKTSPYATKVDSSIFQNTVQAAVAAKCSLSGFITMPKEACKVPLTYLDRELYVQVYYLDANDVIGKTVNVKYTLTLAPTTDVPADKFGFYYSITNIPVDKKIFIRFIPSNINSWTYNNATGSLYFRLLNQTGNFNPDIHFDGNPYFTWGNEGFKQKLYMGKNIFTIPNNNYIANAEFIYQAIIGGAD